MTIKEIYKQYQIPPNLQEHMLRVAAVGEIITDNWQPKKEVNSQRIVRVLLVHDMAKIISFDFQKSKQLLESETKRADYWQKVQKTFMKEYGSDEEQATLKIASELDLTPEELTILEKIPQVNKQNPVNENNWELAICWYADLRVSPLGVTSFRERLEELIKRSRLKQIRKEEIMRLEGCLEYGLELEKEMQKRVRIRLKAITDSTIELLKEQLTDVSF